MTDDIVTRLRAYNIGNIAHEASSHMEETLYEAADEIERLRVELEHWKSMSKDFSEAFYKGLSTEHTEVDCLLFRYELLCNGLAARS